MRPSSLLSSIAAVNCYVDNLPVTALEPREVEDIFMLGPYTSTRSKPFSSAHPVSNVPGSIRTRL
jgi:hypothetical protein